MMQRCLLYAVLSLAALTSCSKYQFATLNGDVQKTRFGFTDVENDTVAIHYNFSGPDGPVQVIVHNKLSTPLTVTQNTWVLIRNTWPSSDFRSTLIADVRSSTGAEPANGINSEYTRLDVPVKKVVVEPQSSVTLLPVVLRKKFFRLSTPDMVNRQMNGDLIRVQFFTKENTPLRFFNLLSFSTKGSARPISINHEFWVDEAFITMIPPEQVNNFKGREDMFYIRKPSGAGVFLGSIGLLTYFAVSRTSD